MSRFVRLQPPEPPVNPQQLLADAARDFYARLAPPLTASELIDLFAHTSDPAERRAIATRIARTAP